MVTKLREFENELEREIRELELKNARLEAQLEEKRRLLIKLRQSGVQVAVPIQFPIGTTGHGATSGRRSITALGKHYYEVGGQQFNNSGLLLDYFNVPHYFSSKNPRKGDAAARQILRWAKSNPSSARTISVVLYDGTKMDLYAAATKIWP